MCFVWWGDVVVTVIFGVAMSVLQVRLGSVANQGGEQRLGKRMCGFAF